MNDVKNVIDLLKIAKAKDNIQVWVPSKGRTYIFAPMTAKHQKMLTKACFNAKELQSTVYEIIRELSPDYNDFNTADLNNILLTLRKECIGNLIKVGKNEISLASLIERNSKISIDARKTTATAGNPDCLFTFTISPPSLRKDNDLNKHLKNLLSRKEDKDTLASDALAEMVQLQIAGYVNSIEINQNGASSFIDMEQFNLQQKLEIINNLPSSVLPTIFSEIKKFVNMGDQFLTTETDEKISIDETFFIITKA